MGGYQVPYGYNNMNSMGGQQAMYNQQMNMNQGGRERDRDMRGERDISRRDSRGYDDGKGRDRERDRSYDGGRDRDRNYRRY